MTAAACLHDPAIYVSYYFVVPDGHDDNPGAQLQLTDILNSACRELASGTANAALEARIELPDVGESRRLAQIKRHTKGDHEVELEIRTLHDAVCLRAATLRRETCSPSLFPTVPKPHFSSLDGVQVRNLLGSFTVYCAEVEPESSDEELSALATQLAKQCLPPEHGLAPEQWHQFSTRIGAIVFSTRGDMLESVFVYRRRAADDLNFETAFQITLQELALCHLKVENGRTNLAHLLRIAKEQDFALRKLIDHSHPSHLKLRDLRWANDDLTTVRADLVATLARIECELRTLDLCRENFLKALAGSPFELAGPQLIHLLIDRVAIALKSQAVADLGYRQATRERATVHFESLEATINLHEADYTLLLTVVMAVLACAQIASLLPIFFSFEKFEWYTKLAIVLGFTATLSFVVWLLIRFKR